MRFPPRLRFRIPSNLSKPRGRRRGLVLAAAVTAVLVLLGGGTALAMDNWVTLNVDGERRTMHTFADTVDEVLAAAEIELGDKDAVAPARGTELARGAEVMVRHGRELTLALDGESETHWVTALTVNEALRQIGMGEQTLALSVERSAAVPLSGLELKARSAKSVVLLQDQTRIETSTIAPTVRKLLAAHDIELGEHDIVTPAKDTEPTDGMVVNVLRLLSEPQTEEVPIEAEAEERENDEMEKGERKVIKESEDGLKKVTTAMVMRGGEKTEEVIKEKVLKEPVDGIVEIGTKEPEEPEVDPNVGGPADSLNWAALAECESGGDPTAVNPAGYYGLYQFSMATWQSAGGSGLPSEASASEQTMRAKKLYNMVDGNWQGQWPVCGVHLFD